MRLALGACVCLAAGALLAQEPAIKVDVDLVNVLCSVHDKRGGLIGNLEKSDFIVAEDGKRQQIKYFTRETDLPLTLGLLVDVSKSQENLLEIERRAAYQFFQRMLRKKDMAFLISFGHDAELMQDSTSSPRLLEQALNDLRLSVPVGGLEPGPVPTMTNNAGTILYDAVYLASNEKMRSEVGRKALVLITDGMDFGSHYKIDQAIEAAQKADTIVYGIYYVDRGAYGWGFGGVSDSALKRMSEETGGRVFHVDRKHTLDDIFQEIQAELRSQYAIAYTPTNPVKDGAFRRLDIRTTDKDLRVQARKGYYAMRASTN